MASDTMSLVRDKLRAVLASQRFEALTSAVIEEVVTDQAPPDWARRSAENALARALLATTTLPLDVQDLAIWWKKLVRQEARQALLLDPAFMEAGRASALKVCLSPDWLADMALLQAERRFLGNWPVGIRDGNSLLRLWRNRVRLDALTLAKRRRAELANPGTSALVMLATDDDELVKKLAASDLRAALDEAMARLSPNQHRALRLRYYEELAPAEAAERMGVGEASLRSTTSQALERLRLILASRAEELQEFMRE